MSCYRPLVGIPDGFTENGKVHYAIKGNLDLPFVRKEHPDAVLIPCGKCIGCRLDYSRSWADRMMLELETAKKAIFVTLTYRNQFAHATEYEYATAPDDCYFPIGQGERLDGSHLLMPVSFTLDKRDFQLFMKRLRRNKLFEGVKLRFYAAGEYGESTYRPHMHFILFGVGLDDIPDLHSFGVNEFGQTYYLSDTFARIWRNGFVLLSDVSWQTCAYVARYVTKKLGNDVLMRDYLNQIPEFSLMSRKPGIGREYLAQHPDCLDLESVNISTPDGGRKISIPRYYYRQLSYESENNPLYNPEKYDNIRATRRELSNDALFLKMQKTELPWLKQLEVEENKKLAEIKSLKRSKA